MKLEFEHLKTEIFYCMIEQDYFNLKLYLKEIKKIDNSKEFPMWYKEMLKKAINKIITYNIIKTTEYIFKNEK